MLMSVYNFKRKLDIFKIPITDLAAFRMVAL